ncbi:MAG: secretin N-terminal domain-containing protein [Alphaproteobacteria bacterium]|nr:secretin N-terminal domain-containing protein [Alphaproteobacteria bacterium]
MKLRHFGWSAFVISCIVNSGCDTTIRGRYTSSSLNDQSVRKMMTPVEEDERRYRPRSAAAVPSIPDELKQNVSLTLNERLSLSAVLYEAARALNLNFQMSPNVDAKIIFQARNKPFIEILDAVCDMADLRYTISNKMVTVSKDTPFSATYSLQFLNFARASENKISIATEVASVDSSDKDKKSPSSDSNVTVSSKCDFWSEVDDALKIILGNGGRYSINRQSGIITVLGNSKTQHIVRDYIDKLKEASMSQVLIEAKIIEVSLKNEYRRGINWGLLSGRFKLGGSLGDNASNGISNMGSKGDPITFSYASSNSMSSIVSALEEFGSTRTISNPRITAMNNQSAVLKVAQNHVYFQLHYDKSYGTSSSDRSEVSISSDIKTVPIGLVMFVQPSIDTTNGTITLFLRPTITKLAGAVNDPAVDIAMHSASQSSTKYTQSQVPITEVREVSSVLKLNDGEIAVLGGFMEVRSLKNNSGIPGVRDVPVVGELVSSHGVGDEIVELVILIKVRLADNIPLRSAADTRLQRLVPDPRPF